MFAHITLAVPSLHGSLRTMILRGGDADERLTTSEMHMCPSNQALSKRVKDLQYKSSSQSAVVTSHCTPVISSHLLSSPRASWPIYTVGNHLLSLPKKLPGDVSTQYSASWAMGVTHYGRPAEPVEARLPVYDLKLWPTPLSLVIQSVTCYKVVRAIAVGRVSRR